MAVVEIEILGHFYSLQSDRAPAHVKAVAAYVDEQLRAVCGGQAELVKKDHAILAALNIASELFLLREGTDSRINQADQGLAAIQAFLDRSLSATGLPPSSGPVSAPR